MPAQRAAVTALLPGPGPGPEMNVCQIFLENMNSGGYTLTSVLVPREIGAGWSPGQINAARSLKMKFSWVEEAE